MSGFALVFDHQEAVISEDRAHTALRDGVGRYKRLDSTPREIKGLRYIVSKFDTPTTAHSDVVVDAQTGSWLMVVGVAISRVNVLDTASLQSLLARYLKHGSEALKDLDGAFALVIYDKPVDRLIIASDPLGFYSVFYAQQGTRVYVSTSALAIAEVVQAAPSEYGIYLFLSTGSVYGRATLWQEVHRLPAGTVLELTQAGCHESVYWSPGVKDEISRLSLVDSVHGAIDLLSQLIRACAKNEAAIWVDLTGGFDSRLVAALVENCGLSFRATCEGPSAAPDVGISSHIAHDLGWVYQHNQLPENWGQERYAFLSQALGKGDAHYEVLKLSGVIWDQYQRAQELNTSICGLGGELWRGFFWKQEFSNMGRSATVNYDRLVDYRILHPIDAGVFNDASRIRWIREELKSLLRSVADQYIDLPNTLKLDCIYAFKNTGHTGAHISSVTGLQRVFAPLFFKEAMTFAISTNFRWRNHSRLVRHIIEEVNPSLANFETTAGGPAIPIRASNFSRFIPYWSALGVQLLQKGSRVLLQRSLIPVARSMNFDYPRHRWRRDTLNCLDADGVLDYAQMRSGALYNPQRLADFVKAARTEQFEQDNFLSRILTVEMALRAVGASL